MIVALPADPAVLNHPEYQTKFWTNYFTPSSQQLQGADAKYIAVPLNSESTPESLLLVLCNQPTTVPTFMS